MRLQTKIALLAAMMAGGCFFSTAAVATVQADVNAAASGATVTEAAGNYREQITITQNLNLRGAGLNLTTIESPDFGSIPAFTPTSTAYPIINIQNAASVNVSDLTIDGRNQGHPTNNRFTGISYYNAGGTINNTRITNVQEGPTSGGQHGFAVRAVTTGATSATVNITNNTMDNFQKGAIVASGTNLAGTISGNTITARGNTSTLVQNGIQVSGGATYQVTSNTISGFGYAPATTNPAAILLISPGAGTNVDDNTITGTGGADIAIYLNGQAAVNIRNNAISGSRYGVYVDSTNMTGEIANNKTIQTVDEAITVTGGRVAGGITNSGTISNADGTAISLTGLTGSTPITLNGGRILGNVTDNVRSNGYSPVSITNDFTTEGNFTVSSLTVSANKTFKVAATNLVTLNTLSPGAGTLGFAVSSATQYGAINVDSSANIAAMNIAVYVANKDSVRAGDELKVIRGTGALTGSVSSVTITDNSNLYDFQAIDGASASTPTTSADLFLRTIASNKVTTNAPSPGSKAAASVLTSLVSTTDPQLQQVLAKLDSAETTAATNSVLAAVQPPIDDSVVVGALNVSTSAMRLTAQRLAQLRTGESGVSAGTGMADKNLWVQTYGQSTKQGLRQGVAGYDEHTAGVALGMDTDKIVRNSTVGIAVGYGLTQVQSSNATQTRSNIRSYQSSLYGSYHIDDRTFVSAVLSHAYNTVNGLRQDVGGVAGLEAQSHFAARQTSLRTELGRDFTARGLNLTPKLLMNAMRFRQDSYTETGAGGANLHVEGDPVSSFEMGATLEASKKMGEGDGSYWKPSLRLGFRHEFIGDIITSTSHFTGGGAAWRSEGFSPARNMFSIGAGLSFYSTKAWEFLFNYDMEFKEDAISRAGVLRVAHKW